MEINNRRAINDKLNKYCYIAKEDDYIEVTEWTNKEGWDIEFNNKHISLTSGELDAINFLTRKLEYDH